MLTQPHPLLLSQRSLRCFPLNHSPTPRPRPSMVLRRGSKEGTNPAALAAAWARTGLVLTPPPTHPGRRIYLEKKAPGREREGKRSYGLRVWDPPGCPERSAGSRGGVLRCAERGGTPGAGCTARSPSGILVSLGPGAPLRAASGLTWPLRTRRYRGRSLPSLPAGGSPASPHLPLCVLRLSHYLYLASPSSVPPSVSRRDGHLSRSLGLPLCPGCRSPSLFQLLLCTIFLGSTYIR